MAKKNRRRSTARKPSQPKVDRWQVTILRETLEEAVAYVTAESHEAAEALADGELWDGEIFEFDAIDSEITFEVTALREAHELQPLKATICKACLKRVKWTGIAADDPENRSGTSIPGPWVHI